MTIRIATITALVGLAGMTVSGCVNHAADPEFNGSYYIWNLQRSTDRTHYPDRDYDPPNR